MAAKKSMTRELPLHGGAMHDAPHVRVANLSGSTPTSNDDAPRTRRIGTPYADMAGERYKYA
jgi:hypothetical protein